MVLQHFVTAYKLKTILKFFKSHGATVCHMVCEYIEYLTIIPNVQDMCLYVTATDAKFRSMAFNSLVLEVWRYVYLYLLVYLYPTHTGRFVSHGSGLGFKKSVIGRKNPYPRPQSGA